MIILLKTASVWVSFIQIMQIKVQNKRKSVRKSKNNEDLSARVAEGEGSGTGKVGRRWEKEEWFDGFDAIGGRVRLSGPTWQTHLGVPYLPPYCCLI